MNLHIISFLNQDGLTERDFNTAVENPGSTWTYLTSDNPYPDFKIGTIAGAENIMAAFGLAAMLIPAFFLYLVSFLKKTLSKP